MVGRTDTVYQALVSTGFEYNRHFASSPWTLPSIASLLTGALVHDHRAGSPLASGVLQARTPLASGSDTLAAKLARNGYFTRAIVTNPFLSSAYGVDQGFCEFENLTMEGEAYRRFTATTPGRFVQALVPHVGHSDRAHAVLDRAATVLLSPSTKHRPTFLWVHLIDPHAPYGDTDAEPSTFASDLLAFQGDGSLTAPFSGLARIRAGELRPTPQERQLIRSYYEKDVQYADGALSRFLSRLQSHGVLDSTVLIFTSDHGEEFWEHGGVEHGRTLFDEVLHVPFVVRPPGGTNPRSLTYLTAMPQLHNLIVAFADSSTSVVELLPPAPSRFGGILFGEEIEGARTEAYKYVRYQHGTELLFDLTTDAAEIMNLIGKNVPELEELRELAGVAVDDPH